MKLCACGCGELIPDLDKRGHPLKYKKYHVLRVNNSKPVSIETRKKLSLLHSGDKHHMWKGGIKNHSAGYTYIWKPDHPFATSQGYVAEHRLVMEKHLGRYLTEGEDIHHKNHDTKDNRIENLQLMTSSEHTTLHQLARWGEYHKKYGVFNKTLHQRNYRLRKKIFNTFTNRYARC